MYRRAVCVLGFVCSAVMLGTLNGCVGWPGYDALEVPEIVNILKADTSAYAAVRGEIPQESVEVQPLSLSLADGTWAGCETSDDRAGTACTAFTIDAQAMWMTGYLYAEDTMEGPNDTYFIVLEGPLSVSDSGSLVWHLVDVRGAAILDDGSLGYAPAVAAAEALWEPSNEYFIGVESDTLTMTTVGDGESWDTVELSRLGQ